MWQNTVTFSTVTSWNDTKYYSLRADHTAHRQRGGVTLTDRSNWQCSALILQFLFYSCCGFIVFYFLIHISGRDNLLCGGFCFRTLLLSRLFADEAEVETWCGWGGGVLRSCCSFPEMVLFVKHSWRCDPHLCFKSLSLFSIFSALLKTCP